MKESYNNFNESESVLKKSAEWLAKQGLDLAGATLVAGITTTIVNQGLNVLHPGMGYNFFDPEWAAMFAVIAGSTLANLKRNKHE